MCSASMNLLRFYQFMSLLCSDDFLVHLIETLIRLPISELVVARHTRIYKDQCSAFLIFEILTKCS